jgi:uncharacterized protein
MKHPVMHFEIMGKDAPKLRSFYGDVFGWNIGAPMPESGVEYSLVDPVPGFQRGISGGIGKAPEGYDGHVTFYVVVDDVESALGQIEKRGGTRMMGPDKVPNGPVIGLFRDPEGHTIGLVDPGDEMQGAPLELVPFVYFYGKCAEALEFYKKALDGSYEILMQDGDKVNYATFTGPGISFKAADGTGRTPIDPDAGNITLALTAPTAQRGEEVFKALAEGGKVVTPFGDAEWGGKFGNLHDRFGNDWYVASE